ncbi:MAG: hypothetical protein HY860_04790 [Chlamydiales bacterium]|nr:hypothetical protein [Chlamydiales bacterium]
MSGLVVSPVFTYFDQVDRAVEKHANEAEGLHEFYVVNPNKVYYESLLESHMYLVLKVVATVAFVIIVGATTAFNAIISLASLPLSIIISALLTDLFYHYVYMPLDKQQSACDLDVARTKTIIQLSHQLSLKSNDELEEAVRDIIGDHFDEAFGKISFLCPDEPIRGFILPLANYYMYSEQVAPAEKLYQFTSAALKKTLGLVQGPKTDLVQKAKGIQVLDHLATADYHECASKLIHAKLLAVLAACSMIEPTRQPNHFFFSPLNAATHVRVHDIDDTQGADWIGFKKDSSGQYLAIPRKFILDSSVEEIVDWLMDSELPAGIPSVDNAIPATRRLPIERLSIPDSDDDSMVINSDQENSPVNA